MNNYSLRISRNEEQISKNNATLGNAGYLPTVDFTAGYTSDLNSSDSKLRADGSTASERNVLDHTLDAGIDLNWTIFDGFNISTTYKQLQELERQGATNTRIAIEDFIATLTAEYYNYIQQEIRLKNFRYAVSLSKEYRSRKNVCASWKSGITSGIFRVWITSKPWWISMPIVPST